MLEREKTVINSMAPELALLTTGVRVQLEIENSIHELKHLQQTSSWQW